MQKIVKAFMEKYRLSCGPEARYIDLVSEIGELGKEILKDGDYGRKEPMEDGHWKPGAYAKLEMGDCLFSLYALCCEMNINAEEALQEALEKYKSRFESKGGIGSGD